MSIQDRQKAYDAQRKMQTRGAGSAAPTAAARTTTMSIAPSRSMCGRRASLLVTTSAEPRHGFFQEPPGAPALRTAPKRVWR